MIFRDKVVLITGASTGIGKSLAKKIFNEGSRLILVARRKNLLDELKNTLNAEKKILTIGCDVSNAEEVSNLIKSVKDHFGKIDIAILNAGISNRMPIDKFSSGVADEIFSTNTFGIINFVENILPDFISERRGIIVGVSSLADSRGFPKSGFYNASKSAASIILESLRIELKPYNIKVVTVRPGFVETPMTDKNEFYMPTLMHADKAADIILKGLKKDKRIIQFPKTLVLAVSFFRTLPSFIFEWMASKPLPARKDKVVNIDS
jgi:short-subunit dehydrogenase